jgi:hypothetical protein
MHHPTATARRSSAWHLDHHPKPVRPVADTDHGDTGQADQQRAHTRSIRFQAGAPRNSTTSNTAENCRAPAPRPGSTRSTQTNPQTRSALLPINLGGTDERLVSRMRLRPNCVSGGWSFGQSAFGVSRDATCASHGLLRVLPARGREAMRRAGRVVGGSRRRVGRPVGGQGFGELVVAARMMGAIRERRAAERETRRQARLDSVG